MKITFEETLSRKEWLHKELMESLTGDVNAYSIFGRTKT